MALETHTTVIKGRTYKVKELGAKQSRRVLALIAPYIAELTSVGTGEAAESDAIKRLLSKITKADLDTLTDDVFAELTQVSNAADGSSPVPLTAVIEELFGGKGAVDWMLWLFFCMKINFGGFSNELGDLFGGLGGVATHQPSTSPTISEMTGTSGA